MNPSSLNTRHPPNFYQILHHINFQILFHHLSLHILINNLSNTSIITLQLHIQSPSQLLNNWGLFADKFLVYFFYGLDHIHRVLSLRHFQVLDNLIQLSKSVVYLIKKLLCERPLIFSTGRVRR